MPHEIREQQPRSTEHEQGVCTHSAWQLTAALDPAQGGGAAAYGRAAPVLAGNGQPVASPPVLTQVSRCPQIMGLLAHVCLAGRCLKSLLPLPGRFDHVLAPRTIRTLHDSVSRLSQCKGGAARQNDAILSLGP